MPFFVTNKLLFLPLHDVNKPPSLPNLQCLLLFVVYMCILTGWIFAYKAAGKGLQQILVITLVCAVEVNLLMQAVAHVYCQF